MGRPRGDPSSPREPVRHQEDMSQARVRETGASLGSEHPLILRPRAPTPPALPSPITVPGPAPLHPPPQFLHPQTCPGSLSGGGAAPSSGQMAECTWGAAGGGLQLPPAVLGQRAWQERRRARAPGSLDEGGAAPSGPGRMMVPGCKPPAGPGAACPCQRRITAP